MKNKTVCYRGAVYLLSALLLVTACKKNDTGNTSEDDSVVGADHGLAEKSFNDVESISDQAAVNGNLTTYRQEGTILSGCATVTRDTVSVPHVITIDFGTTDCLCGDGVYRRGKIIVTYQGHYRDSGSTHTITFSNYFVNSNQLTGSKTVTNMGTNSSGQPYFNIAVNGSVILANNNGTITWTSDRVRTWVAGYDTADWSDDVYQLTGSGSLTRANGRVYSIEITNPLVMVLSCRWIEKGTVRITPSGGVARTLDYGDGTCDALATYTIGNHTYNITLR